MATSVKSRTEELGPEATNGAAHAIGSSVPYRVKVKIRGDADILFHRWNVEGIEAKSKAAKGSKEKKSDNIESYLYRDDAGNICIPGEYLRQAVVNAAKFRQDPRSPRKSAADLVKAAVINLTPLASLGISKWDYEHRCRVQVQRNGITRCRPAVKAGWECSFILMINLPEYVSQEMLHGMIADAGRLIGLGDFRPTYGRFQIIEYKRLKE